MVDPPAGSLRTRAVVVAVPGAIVVQGRWCPPACRPRRSRRITTCRRLMNKVALRFKRNVSRPSARSSCACAATTSAACPYMTRAVGQQRLHRHVRRRAGAGAGGCGRGRGDRSRAGGTHADAGRGQCASTSTVARPRPGPPNRGAAAPIRTACRAVSARGRCWPLRSPDASCSRVSTRSRKLTAPVTARGCGPASGRPGARAAGALKL